MALKRYSTLFRNGASLFSVISKITFLSRGHILLQEIALAYSKPQQNDEMLEFGENIFIYKMSNDIFSNKFMKSKSEQVYNENCLFSQHNFIIGPFFFLYLKVLKYMHSIKCFICSIIFSFSQLGTFTVLLTGEISD